MAKMMILVAAVVLVAGTSQLVLADADAEFKVKLGAAVMPMLRKAMKFENNWVTGLEMTHVCADGKFDFVQDTRMTSGRGVATLADAQKACSADSIKSLLAANSKAGGSVKTEQECKELVEKTLSDPVLCNRKENEYNFRMKDLEGIRVLFAGATPYQALADAVKSKAQTKLGIVGGKDTCPEGMSFCYQCWTATGFVALSCAAFKIDCRSGAKPEGDLTKMLTVGDLEAICKDQTMFETQKECKAFLEHELNDKYKCGNRINYLSEMIALIKPPTHRDPGKKGTEKADEPDYHSGEGHVPPRPLYRKEKNKDIKFGVVSK